MIYLVSKKYLKKNIKKIAWASEYVLLDGENYGITGKTDAIAIYTEYASSHPVGGFCPDRVLYGYLIKLKKGEAINQVKFNRELDLYLTDKAFIFAVVTALKVIIANKHQKHNAIIVLPNIVYKEIGYEIAEAILDLCNVDFELLFTEDEITNPKKMMDKHLSNKQLEVIGKRIEKICRKYHEDFEEYYSDVGYSSSFNDGGGSLWPIDEY